MAQTPPDHNFYYPHQHVHPTQIQFPPQFRSTFPMLFDERTGAFNYNYLRPFMQNPMSKPGIEITCAEDYSDPLVMRRPRRSRTTFSPAQVTELEEHFAKGRYLTADRLAELSAKLHLGSAQVKIWFKNRRRRNKIIADQRSNEQNSTRSDDMPPSPSMASQKSEETKTVKETKTPLPENPPTPNLSVLTPSPTPTTHSTNAATAITPHVAEHFNHTADPYSHYYFNQQLDTIPHAHQHINTQGTRGQTQTQTHHHHHNQYATNPIFANQHLHQTQQEQAQLLQQHSSYYTGLKQEPNDFSFNNAYFLGKSAFAVPPAVDTAINSANTDTYEPLTPKNDENHSNNTMCNETNNGYGDINANFNSKTFHTLQPKKMNGQQRFSTGYPGVLTKPEKPNEMHDINYQCTLDTLMHAYSNHRNSNNNAHLATYCFN